MKAKLTKKQNEELINNIMERAIRYCVPLLKKSAPHIELPNRTAVRECFIKNVRLSCQKIFSQHPGLVVGDKPLNESRLNHDEIDTLAYLVYYSMLHYFGFLAKRSKKEAAAENLRKAVLEGFFNCPYLKQHKQGESIPAQQNNRTADFFRL